MESPLPATLMARGRRHGDKYRVDLAIQGSAHVYERTVPVTVLLRSRVINAGWIEFSIVMCHDPEIAELIGTPVYTYELLSMLGPGGTQFYTVDDREPYQDGYGFIWWANLNRFAYNDRFPSDVPMALMTVYYRLIGQAGNQGLVSFCNYTLARENPLCNYNTVFTYPTEPYSYHDYVPNSPVSGILTILPGLPTHPDRPPEPPIARVYPRPEGAEAVNFIVRIEGATALPGERDVPVRVYVAADREYTGISLPIDLDERYLRLSRAEEDFPAGVALVDNAVDEEAPSVASGHAVVFSRLGVDSHRLAREGEEILAATPYFDLKKEAATVGETALAVHPVTAQPAIAYRSWVGVNYEAGPGSERPFVRVEAEPIRIAGGLLKIQRRPTRLEDANLDYEVNLADPIDILDGLFLGGTGIFCPEAADFNEDESVDISDAVAILSYLFLNSSAASAREVSCADGR